MTNAVSINFKICQSDLKKCFMFNAFLLLFCGAFRADAFEHVVDGTGPETGGDVNHRYTDIFEAEGLHALLAIKVDMLVVKRVVRVAVAQLVFKRTASVLDYVYYILCCKKFKYAEYACLVEGVECSLQVGETYGTRGRNEFLHDEDAVGGRFYPFPEQDGVNFVAFHT